MSRLPNLDPLRFVLASFVIFYHVPMLSKNQGLPYFSEAAIFNRGTEAVYMFFALSGFLIVGQIYRLKKKGVFSIRNFLMRRSLRILPLYYLIVFFGFFFYWVFLPFVNIPFENNYPLLEGFALALFFVPNILDILYKPGGILEVLWSIGIEVQFYLFVAPALYFFKARRLLLVLSIISIVYFLLFHFSALDFLKTYNFVFFFIFIGGLVGLLEEYGYLNVLKKTRVFPIIITVLTILFFTTDFVTASSAWVNNLCLAVLFSLFIHTLAYNNYGLEIKNRWINYFGRISYGIYMYHVICMNLVVFLMLRLKEHVLLNDTLSISLIYIFTFAITIFVAGLSYRYFEAYFLKLKTKYKK